MARETADERRARLEQHVRELVDKAPPLSAAQIARLRVLLRS